MLPLQGRQAAVAVAGLDPQCRYEIFGDSTAVAMIGFRLVLSGNDNTELFSSHYLSFFEGSLLLEDHPTARFDWPWGISFQVTLALFLN